METMPASLEILSESFAWDDTVGLEQFMRIECQMTEDEIAEKIEKGETLEQIVPWNLLVEVFIQFLDDDKRMYFCMFRGENKLHSGLVHADDTLQTVIERLLPGSPVSQMKNIPEDDLKKTMKEFEGFAGVVDVTEP
jgi:hypothetical protein